MRLGLLLW